MHRSPTRTSVRSPRATLLAGGSLLCALLVGASACDQTTQPGEGASGGAGPAAGGAAAQSPGSAGAGAAAGAGGVTGAPSLPLPDATGKIDPRLLADATVNQPREVVVMMDQQVLSTLAVDQALASATDPNQTYVVTSTQVSPGCNFPSAARHASFALVPVPQGERSYALPGHCTKFFEPP